MKIFTWNVNGIRSIFKTTFIGWLKANNPDIVCLQEIKADFKELPAEYTQINGYYAYFNFSSYTNQLVETLLESNMNYVAVYPNNDPGTDVILNAYQKHFSQHPRFALYPSLRFEHFLTMLKNTRFVIGNSSAGVREAPYYGTPTINIGNRQNGRVKVGAVKSIKHCDYSKEAISAAIKAVTNSTMKHRQTRHFGNAGSDKKFLDILLNQNIWGIKAQKQFLDIDF